MLSIIASLVKPLAYASVPVIVVHTVAESSPLARYYLRLYVYLSTLGLCSVWGACVAVGMSLVGRRFDVNWVVARSFYALGRRALGIRFEVEGEEHLDTRPAVIVGNHQSMLDILYLGRIIPQRMSIMAKKELQWMPLLGQFMSLSGAVFVDRGNNARAVRSLTAAGEKMKERGTSLWLFPEGTRSMREAPDLLSFKKGAFHLAVQSQLPIVPVVCENYWRLYRHGVFDTGSLRLRVLPPVPTTGLKTEDVPALANRVRDLMLTALREISVPVPNSTASASSPSPPPSDKSQSQIIDERATPMPPFSKPDVFRDASRESVPSSASSDAPSSGWQREASENGTETEEDEGMVLVGRPQQS